jgi:hypothetical protein
MRHAKKYCIVLLLLSGFGVIQSADFDPEGRPEGQQAQIAQRANSRPRIVALNGERGNERGCCNQRNQERLLFGATGFAVGMIMQSVIHVLSSPQQ